ncbi:AAA family ATPase [OM182 bacterium]|jgi:flagellar biosynthesis protein FlhG|nr:AAA family ATPase [OM182 bacterium]
MKQESIKKNTTVIGIASGKGGVGKTTFAINLATHLVSSGKKVLMFDADFGLANLHIALREKLTGNLLEVLNGEKLLKDVIIDVSPGLSLISGGNGLNDILSIDESKSHQVIQAFAELENIYDYMIVDISAGASDSVVTFLSACTHRIVIGTDEPSSIADAYAVIKLLTIKKGFSDLIFVPNRVKSIAEGHSLFTKMNQIVAKFLNSKLQFIGAISYSTDYNRAWTIGKPAISLGQSTVAKRDIKNLCSELNQIKDTEPSKSLMFFSHS